MNMNTVARLSAVERTHADYRRSTYFPGIGGLRALSVLLVLTWHNHDDFFLPLRGYLGVTVFFLISGFLITTLLLREEDSSGRISIQSFYIRRAFRIFPLYYLALAVYCFLVFVVHLGADRQDFASRLPYFLTYTNEFASYGTFGHSWSLGVEEKFYLVWPLLAFGVPWLRRWRRVTAVALSALMITCAYVPGIHYLAIYLPIIIGCVLALTMHSKRGFAMARFLARPPVAVFAIVVALAAARGEPVTHVHVVFSLAAVLMMPAFILGGTWLTLPIESAPMNYIGRCSYGIYLFHPITMSLVDVVLPTNGTVGVAILRFLLVTASSLAVADILYRCFELPLINRGRRIIDRRRKTADAQSKPMSVIANGGSAADTVDLTDEQIPVRS